MRYLLLTLILLSCSCVSEQARFNQSTAAANIYHAALALERGVNPKHITPRIKDQAILILKTNGDTLKGVEDGN